MDAARQFRPRLDILPPSQRWLWDELADVPQEFVLYGDTAVALHLGHRQSHNFDFFGSRQFDPNVLASWIQWLAEAEIVQSEANTLTAAVQGEARSR